MGLSKKQETKRRQNYAERAYLLDVLNVSNEKVRVYVQ